MLWLETLLIRLLVFGLPIGIILAAFIWGVSPVLQWVLLVGAAILIFEKLYDMFTDAL